MSKKKLLTIIGGTIVGLLAALYLFLVIYTNFINPPKAGNDHLTTKEWFDLREAQKKEKE